jgi:hypothetical protein
MLENAIEVQEALGRSYAILFYMKINSQWPRFVLSGYVCVQFVLHTAILTQILSPPK